MNASESWSGFNKKNPRQSKPHIDFFKYDFPTINISYTIEGNNDKMKIFDGSEMLKL